VRLVNRLPLGLVEFSGQAFQDRCAAVTPEDVATWLADPVGATLVAGTVAEVTLKMRRNGRANVNVDFEDSGPLLGSPCSSDADCAGAACVEGLCCSDACTRPCESCVGVHTGGSDGVCAPVLAATDPRAGCADQDPSTCGTNGLCDGSSPNCPLYAAGTQCSASTCLGGASADPADVCDGLGTCVAVGPEACPMGYACVSGACRTTCTDDTDCASGYRCDVASSTCRTNDGATCTSPSDCGSGRCVDGVCCDAACISTCQACRADLKQDGTSDGTCGAIAAGADPDSECPLQPVSSCGTTGACNGAGACALYPAGTTCGVAMSCDGAGACQ
jgi:hypothetical protein